jgi:AraC-like DNA-binding protein
VGLPLPSRRLAPHDKRAWQRAPWLKRGHRHRTHRRLITCVLNGAIVGSVGGQEQLAPPSTSPSSSIARTPSREPRSTSVCGSTPTPRASSSSAALPRPALRRRSIARCPPELKLAEDGKGILKRVARGLLPPQIVDRPAERNTGAMAFAPPARHLLRARDLADARYAEPLGVEEMAAAAGLSKAHFSREFRRAFGESPYAYLLTRRLERAAALLRSTDRSISDICLSVGLTSLGSFTTSFTRTFGLSPAAYRQRFPAAADMALVPGCIVRAYGRPQKRTFREDRRKHPV